MVSKSSVIKYHPSKTLEQLTEYLSDTKNIQYNIISREQAKIILWKYGNEVK